MRGSQNAALKLRLSRENHVFVSASVSQFGPIAVFQLIRVAIAKRAVPNADPYSGDTRE